MEAATSTRSKGNAWRLWALAPVLFLAVVVGAFVTSGSSLLDLVGRNPPPADEFDIRRIEFRPGEIRVRVTNPQTDAITIASVDCRQRNRAVHGRRAFQRQAPALEHGRRPVRLGPGRADLRRHHQLDRDRDGRGRRRRGRDSDRLRKGLPRLRDHRLSGRRRTRRVGPPLAAVAAPGEPEMARCLHGTDRRAPFLPRRRGAVRGVPAAGGAACRHRRRRARPARGRAQLSRHDVPLGAAALGRQGRRWDGACPARRGRHRRPQPRRRAGDRKLVRVRRAQLWERSSSSAS